MEELLIKLTAAIAVYDVRLKDNVIYFKSNKTRISYNIQLVRDQFHVYHASMLLDVCEDQESVIKCFTPEPNIGTLKEGKS